MSDVRKVEHLVLIFKESNVYLFLLVRLSWSREKRRRRVINCRPVSERINQAKGKNRRWAVFCCRDEKKRCRFILETVHELMSLRIELPMSTGGVQMVSHGDIQSIAVHIKGESLMVGWIDFRGEKRQVIAQHLIHHSLMRVDVLLRNSCAFGRTSRRIRRRTPWTTITHLFSSTNLRKDKAKSDEYDLLSLFNTQKTVVCLYSMSISFDSADSLKRALMDIFKANLM